MRKSAGVANERFTPIQAVGIAAIVALLGVLLHSVLQVPVAAAPSGSSTFAQVSGTTVPATGMAQTVAALPAGNAASSGKIIRIRPVTNRLAASPHGASAPAVAAQSHRAAGVNTAGYTRQAGSVTAPSPSGRARVPRTRDSATGQVMSARVPSAGGSTMAAGPSALAQTPAAATASVAAPTQPSPTPSNNPGTSTTSSSPTGSTPPATSGSGSGTGAGLGVSIPAGHDGTWIVPPILGDVIGGLQLPDVPGLATGPAPVGDVLALGTTGSMYAFDVTTRTWILTPPSFNYQNGVGYVSDGSMASVVSSGSSTGSDGSGSTTASDGGTADPSPASVGPDGRWIVAPVSLGTDLLGNVLPQLPGLAEGPAPAGNVLALGTTGSMYAFDVTTRTWIMTPDPSMYTYRPGVGYVSAP